MAYAAAQNNQRNNRREQDRDAAQRRRDAAREEEVNRVRQLVNLISNFLLYFSNIFFGAEILYL